MQQLNIMYSKEKSIIFLSNSFNHLYGVVHNRKHLADSTRKTSLDQTKLYLQADAEGDWQIKSDIWPKPNKPED